MFSYILGLYLPQARSYAPFPQVITTNGVFRRSQISSRGRICYQVERHWWSLPLPRTCQRRLCRAGNFCEMREGAGAVGPKGKGNSVCKDLGDRAAHVSTCPSVVRGTWDPWGGHTIAQPQPWGGQQWPEDTDALGRTLPAPVSCLTYCTHLPKVFSKLGDPLACPVWIRIVYWLGYNFHFERMRGGIRWSLRPSSRTLTF